MLSLDRNGYPAPRVKSVLHAREGSRKVKFCYDLVRDGRIVGQLPITAASIRYDESASIKRTARLTLLADDRIIWEKDRIKAYMLLRMEDNQEIITRPKRTWGSVKKSTWGDLRGRHIWKAIEQELWERVRQWTWEELQTHSTWAKLNERIYERSVHHEKWAEFPLGVFLPSTPTRHFEYGAVYEVEAYDLCVILKEDCIIDRLCFSKGTRYLSAVNQVLSGAGITGVVYEDSAVSLPTDREFEPGTSTLEIVNTLLTEAGYRTLTVDADGIFRVTLYTEPTVDKAGYEYRSDELSVIGRSMDTELDLYSVPNVFVGIVSNPDYSLGASNYQYFRAQVTNDDPESPLSTVARGRRIVQLLRPEDIASQAALHTYVRRAAYEAMQVYEQVQFQTALMPMHEGGDVLILDHPDAAGVYEETGWEMDLRAGGIMSHNARKVRVLSADI